MKEGEELLFDVLGNQWHKQCHPELSQANAMIHARDDYNRIQDPAVDNPSMLGAGSTPIAEDEPVFLIRAQDQVSAEAVRYWAYLNETSGGDYEASRLARQQANAMDAWPNKKLADL